jgi:hypothetical protein
MRQIAFQWKDFHEIWYLSNFRKSVEKIQVSLKSDKNNKYFTWRQYTCLIISRWILLILRNVLDKISRENKKIHLMFSNIFRKSCRLWDSVNNRAEPESPQMTIWRMRKAFLIHKATDTHWEYVIVFSFPLQQYVARTRLNVTLYVHCLYCSFLQDVHTGSKSHVASYSMNIWGPFPWG